MHAVVLVWVSGQHAQPIGQAEQPDRSRAGDMEALYGVHNLNRTIFVPELNYEHHEQMGAGDIRLYLPDLAHYLSHVVRLRGAAASDGGIY